VDAPVVLAGEPHAAVDDAPLPAPPPPSPPRLEHHLGADRAAIALGPHQPERDPGVVAGVKVAVQERGLALIGDDHVEDTPIAEVGDGDRAAVVVVQDADRRRHVHPALQPAIHEHA